MDIQELIDKMTEIEDVPDFDGWDAWVALKDWLAEKQNESRAK